MASKLSEAQVRALLDRILAAFHAGDDIALAQACEAADEATHFQRRMKTRPAARARYHRRKAGVAA